MTSRRAFIFGLGATLAVIRTPGLLMPTKPLKISAHELRPVVLTDLETRALLDLKVRKQAFEDIVILGTSMMEMDSDGFAVRALNPFEPNYIDARHAVEARVTRHAYGRALNSLRA